MYLVKEIDDRENSEAKEYKEDLSLSLSHFKVILKENKMVANSTIIGKRYKEKFLLITKT